MLNIDRRAPHRFLTHRFGTIEDLVPQGYQSMVSEATERYRPMAAAYYLYVEDADASMRQALAHGAVLEMDVGDMPYGDRQGGVKDQHGNIWWISQRTVHKPYA